METLYQITAPHFSAGLVIRDGIGVIAAAPILHYMMNWAEEKVIEYCIKKGWSIDFRLL